MGQKEALNLLDKYPKRWFSRSEICEKTGAAIRCGQMDQLFKKGLIEKKMFDEVVISENINGVIVKRRYKRWRYKIKK